ASPSSRASTASVVLLRVPLSFPAGLPLFPGSKGISGVASVLHFQLSARIPGRSSRQNEVLSNRMNREHQGSPPLKLFASFQNVRLAFLRALSWPRLDLGLSISNARSRYQAAIFKYLALRFASVAVLVRS